MQHLSDWASKSLLRTIIAAPVLVVYAIWKLPKALSEWGKS